jgi:hypothetical protein
MPLALSLSSLKKYPLGASPELTRMSDMEYSEVLAEKTCCWMYSSRLINMSNWSFVNVRSARIGISTGRIEVLIVSTETCFIMASYTPTTAIVT